MTAKVVGVGWGVDFVAETIWERSLLVEADFRLIGNKADAGIADEADEQQAQPGAANSSKTKKVKSLAINRLRAQV